MNAPMRGFERSLPMGLLKAREAAMSRFRPLLIEQAVTEQQWRVLRALTSAERPLSVGELAGRTFLLGPSLSRILTNLEQRSLIKRSTAPSDQRRSLLQLTARGRKLVANIAPHSEAAYNQIEADFGKKRLNDLLAELAALEAVLQREPAQRQPAQQEAS